VGVAVEVEELWLLYLSLVNILRFQCHAVVFVGMMLGAELVAAV